MAYQERTQSRDEYRPDKEFGVHYEPVGHSDPTTIFTRLGDAVGMSVNTGVQPHVSDFDSYYPWKGMERYNLDDAGNIYCKWGDTNFDDGNTSAYATCVMIPKFYIKWESVYGTYWNWWISPNRLPGYVTHPAFVRGNREVDCLWVAAYEAYVTGSVPYSRANQNLSSGCNFSRANWRTTCANKGAGWQIIDWLTWQAIVMLWTVEYGPITANSQSIFNGCTASMRYTGYTGKNGPSGCQDAGPGHSRKMTVGSDYPFAYRGIENIWGNVGDVTEGHGVDTSRWLWVHSGDTDAHPYSDTFDDAHGFHRAGIQLLNSASLQYIKYAVIESDASHQYMFLPSTINDGASSSLYLCDGYQTASFANPVCMWVGGGYPDTTYCGIYNMQTQTPASVAHSRLEFVPRADNYYKV